jgi:hypothetical protein
MTNMQKASLASSRDKGKQRLTLCATLCPACGASRCPRGVSAPFVQPQATQLQDRHLPDHVATPSMTTTIPTVMCTTFARAEFQRNLV